MVCHRQELLNCLEFFGQQLVDKRPFHKIGPFCRVQKKTCSNIYLSSMYNCIYLVQHIYGIYVIFAAYVYIYICMYLYLDQHTYTLDPRYMYIQGQIWPGSLQVVYEGTLQMASQRNDPDRLRQVLLRRIAQIETRNKAADVTLYWDLTPCLGLLETCICD